jgi:NifU-like protein involved in Fe-S cluster formation
MWLHLLVAAGFLTVVVGIWFGVYCWLNPRLVAPDGKSRVTGSCGDTMEIRLRFRDNRVAESTHWTNGCVFSLNCISSAAQLTEGKTAEEILDISPETVAESIGGLPKDHMHCATLATATLREAVHDYMKNCVHKPDKPFPRFATKHFPKP